MTVHEKQKNTLFNLDHLLQDYHDSRMKWPGSASYHRHLNEFLLEHVPHDSEHVVLDAMCGTGVFLSTLCQHYRTVVGFDLSKKALDYSHQYNDALAQADAIYLPFKDASFDVVVVRGGLHHVPNIGQAIAELSRVLVEGGYCVILESRDDNFLVQNIRKLVFRLREVFEPDEERGLSSREVHNLMQEAKLKPLHYEPYGLLGFALYCNPDTIRFTYPFSFLPAAAKTAVWLSKLDRLLCRLPVIRAMAFEMYMIARKTDYLQAISKNAL